MSNKNKRKEKILRVLSSDDIRTVNDIHNKTNIAKHSIRTDLLALVAERKVEQIRDEFNNGYKLR